MAECQNQTDEIMSRTYNFQMLYMRLGGRATTDEEIHVVDLDYPLGHHAKTLLRIGPEFMEPTDNDIPTNEDRQWHDLNIESNIDDQSEDVDGQDDIDASNNGDATQVDMADAQVCTYKDSALPTCGVVLHPLPFSFCLLMCEKNLTYLMLFSSK